MSKRRTGAKQRDMVIARYGQDCNWCGCETVIIGTRTNEERMPANGFTVDHFIPISKGGDNTLENLRPSCRSCNELKGDEIWEDHKGPPSQEQWAGTKLADLWPVT